MSFSSTHRLDAPSPFEDGSAFEEEIAGDWRQADVERRLREVPPRHDIAPLFQDAGEDDDQEYSSDVLEYIQQVIDLTADDDQVERRREAKKAPCRNLEPVYPDRCVHKYTLGKETLKPGITVEIATRYSSQLYKASFLLIQCIIETPRTGKVVFRGLPLTRIRYMRGQLPRHLNEVCQVLLVDDDDERAAEDQAAIEVPVSEVIRIRHCHLTNADFPRHRFPRGIWKSMGEVEEQGVLICRWKCLHVYKNAKVRCQGKAPMEYVIEHLSAHEVPRNRYRDLDSQRLNLWRGGKVRGGAHNPCLSDIVIDVEEPSKVQSQELGWIPKQQGQQYTYADIFCGAGGASCGAQKAGFIVRLGCDHASWACETFRAAFPGARLYEMDVYDLITKVSDISELRVDVMHLSPPCQYWSPAHTVEGKHDDENIAVLFSCHELISKLKPRVFTLEQTFGILHSRFEHFFNALIHGFTQNGYSVRYKVTDLRTYDNAGRRQRLLMFGSCSGEELIPFPPATHSESPQAGDGTRPFTTVLQALSEIPRDAQYYDKMHQPNNRSLLRDKEPWDPRRPLARCITTNGGVGNYHYSGKRVFTLRENAVLQGFPANYPFRGVYVKKQIGNAFPPPVVKILYSHIRKWLEHKDQVYSVEDDSMDDEDLVCISDDNDEKVGQDENNAIHIDDSDGFAYGDDDLQVIRTRQLLRRSSSRTLGRTDSSGEEMDYESDSANGTTSVLNCVDATQSSSRPW